MGIRPLPEYESHVDHQGIINSLDGDARKRGEAIYNRLCINCHGTHDRPGSLPTSLRFASGKFKRGADPYSMSEYESWYSFGPQIRLGLKYELGRNYRLGVMYSTPTLGIYRSVDIVKTHSGPGDGQELSEAAAGLTARPATTRAMASIGFSRRGGVRQVRPADTQDLWVERLAAIGPLSDPLRPGPCRPGSPQATGLCLNRDRPLLLYIGPGLEASGNLGTLAPPCNYSPPIVNPAAPPGLTHPRWPFLPARH